MKHIKEWNTCDRCGLEIKNTLIRKGKAKIKSKIQKGYHIDSLLDNFGIILYTEEAEIDLCPKCRKEFERFMKNENNGNE